MVSAMSSTKGDRVERECINRLRDLGLKIMRAPSSGSATTRDLPDVLAGDGEGIIIAGEVKAGGGERLYLEGKEVSALVRFARGFHPDAVPLIVTRWDRDTNFYVRHAEDERLHRTDSGKVRAKKETCAEEWRTVEDFLTRGGEIRTD
jgi:Holliday junction resolvase